MPYLKVPLSTILKLERQKACNNMALNLSTKFLLFVTNKGQFTFSHQIALTTQVNNLCNPLEIGLFVL
jgi:hypothetical protein